MLGNVVFQKFPTNTQDLSRRSITTSGESVSTYLRRPKAEAFSNAVDVVERLLVPTYQVPNVRHLRVQHTFRSMTIPGLRSSKRGEVVDEFRQHDGVVTVVVKNNLCRASPSTTKTMTNDKLEGTGLPAQSLVNLDVF